MLLCRATVFSYAHLLNPYLLNPHLLNPIRGFHKNILVIYCRLRVYKNSRFHPFIVNFLIYDKDAKIDIV